MSFLGYGNQTPGANINGDFVNKDGSNYPGGFGSNEIPTSCMRGGKKLKRKIKNITKQYKKMKRGKTKSKIMEELSKSKMLTKSIDISGGRRRSRRMRMRLSRRNRSVSRRRRYQRGGSYMSNVPSTPTYSTGGVLSAGSSALANPVPYKVTSENVNCVDNYNHFTGKGIQTV